MLGCLLVAFALCQPGYVQPGYYYAQPQPTAYYAAPPVYPQPQVVYTQPAPLYYAPAYYPPVLTVRVGGGHRHWH